MKDTEIWEIKQIIQQGIENLHPTPSPETKERLVKLETSMMNIALDVSEIKIHTTYIKELIGKLPCTEQNKRIVELEKYNQKQIGMIAVLGMVFGVVGFFISPIISWLLNKIKL